MRYLPFLLLTALLGWSAPSWAIFDMQRTPETKNSPEFVAGQVLLKVAPDTSVYKSAHAVNAKVLRSIGDGSIVLLEVGKGRVAETVRVLGSHKNVLFAEPNWLRRLHAPNDPGFSYKWDLHNDGTLTDGSDSAAVDADVDWLEAYNLLGSGFSGTATIAVIDTGIDAGHPDLDGKMIGGYDFLDNDGDPNDTYGHGTHVAGIVLAETDNGTGTVGTAYGGAIAVMPLRVCNSSGCPTSAIVDAINYAADHGADVINLSLGGRFGSSSEEQAINYAWNKGLVIVASSGNDGSGKVSFPAAFANAIAVGSTNWRDNLAPYSNKGSALDIVAPGGDMSRYHDLGGIYSTMPTYDVYLTTNYSYSRNYDQLQGTSMASPQVAGLAGLLFAANPALSNAEVRMTIESTADDLGKSGRDRDFGWGRINAYNALLLATGTGEATDNPPNVTLTEPQDGATVLGNIDVSAEASDDDGVSAVEFFVGSTSLGNDADNSDGWSVSWDTSTSSEGSHSLTATALDTSGQSSSDSINVVVDNLTDAEVTILSLTPSTIQAGTTADISIAGSGFVAGAVVNLENGSGPTPDVSNVVFVDSGTINATIIAKSGGPPRERLWDVRVTNPDGSSGTIVDALIILP